MFLILYGVAVVIFVAMDLVWLGVVAKDFYREHIGVLLKSDVNWIAAVIFYALFGAALVAFVIAPAVERGSWLHALVWGAFFGLITYATYDLTNLATLKDWSVTVTIVDMAWGAFLGASVATGTYFITTRFML